MSFSDLYLVILLAIIFLLGGFKNGVIWLIYVVIMLSLIVLLYYIGIAIFQEQGKIIFPSIIAFFAILFGFINRQKG